MQDRPELGAFCDSCLQRALASFMFHLVFTDVSVFRQFCVASKVLRPVEVSVGVRCIYLATGASQPSHCNRPEI